MKFFDPLRPDPNYRAADRVAAIRGTPYATALYASTTPVQYSRFLSQELIPIAPRADMHEIRAIEQRPG